jgi:hypothetical protein
LYEPIQNSGVCIIKYDFKTFLCTTKRKFWCVHGDKIVDLMKMGMNDSEVSFFTTKENDQRFIKGE